MIIKEFSEYIENYFLYSYYIFLINMNKERFMKHKPQNIFLKPESVELGKSYAINISPAIQPAYGKLNSFREWYDIHTHLFRDVCIASEFLLYCEISSQGRFHFHGKIKIKNIMDFYIYDVKSLTNNCTCVIKEIEDEDVWEDYYLKQQDFIQPFLQKELFGPLVKSTEPLIRIHTMRD